MCVEFGPRAEELWLGGICGNDGYVDPDGVAIELDNEVHAVLVVSRGGSEALLFGASEVKVVVDVAVQEIDNGVVPCFWDATDAARVGMDAGGV